MLYKKPRVTLTLAQPRSHKATGGAPRAVCKPERGFKQGRVAHLRREAGAGVDLKHVVHRPVRGGRDGGRGDLRSAMIQTSGALPVHTATTTDSQSSPPQPTLQRM